MDDEAWEVPAVPPCQPVVEVLRSPQRARAFQVDVAPYRLAASDADHQEGDGRLLRLPAHELLFVTGRRQPPPHVGEGGAPS